MSQPGYLNPSELTTVQGSLQLSNATARAFIAMRDAAKRDGVTVTIVAPGGAYRSMALTLAMRADPAKYNVTPGIAPSLYSLHMQGIAADIGSGLAWVKSNGHKYGFSFPLKGDPNHSVYDGTTLAGSGTPIIERRNNEMSKLYYKQGTTPSLYALAGDSPGTPANWLETTDQGLANSWSAQIGGPSAALTAGTWDNYKSLYLSPLSVSGGGVADNGPVLSAVAVVETKVDGLTETVSKYPAGASKTDVEAARDQIIAKIPTKLTP